MASRLLQKRMIFWSACIDLKNVVFDRFWPDLSRNWISKAKIGFKHFILLSKASKTSYARDEGVHFMIQLGLVISRAKIVPETRHISSTTIWMIWKKSLFFRDQCNASNFEFKYFRKNSGSSSERNWGAKCKGREETQQKVHRDRGDTLLKPMGSWQWDVIWFLMISGTKTELESISEVAECFLPSISRSKNLFWTFHKIGNENVWPRPLKSASHNFGDICPLKTLVELGLQYKYRALGNPVEYLVRIVRWTITPTVARKPPP